MNPLLVNDCIVRSPSPSPRARLFCFPYAGGSSSIYSRWHTGLSEGTEVYAVELPGRGWRSSEPCAKDMDSLVERLCSAFESMLDLPFFFFGHSMGALLAFSCARALRRRHLRLPEHLFVSARVPPERPNPDRSALTMTDQELIEMIRRRGGTPPEVLAEPDLMARLLPSIRADFVLLDSYRYVPDAPLGCPITGFTGTRDTYATKLDLGEWALHTTGPFSLLEFEGGHFFINSGRDRVVRSVDQAIRDSLRAGGHSRAPG